MERDFTIHLEKLGITRNVISLLEDCTFNTLSLSVSKF